MEKWLRQFLPTKPKDKIYLTELQQCKQIKDDFKKSACIYGLLHEVSELQDRIQLSLPKTNPSMTSSAEHINNINAMMLGMASAKGDIRNAMNDSFVWGKMRATISSFNQLVDDYNLTVKTKDIKPHFFTEEKILPGGTPLDKDIANRIMKSYINETYRGFEK